MIVAGFGFRGSASLESLLDAYAQATAGQKANALATLSDKACSPVFSDFARRVSLPAHHIAPEKTVGVETVTNSPYSRAMRQTGSVAEATALAAIGTNAKIIQPRVVSRDRLATCALAQACEEGEYT